ncbi:cysteine sulfinic acid decarboxylase-like [Glandiceps talaboti]
MTSVLPQGLYRTVRSLPSRLCPILSQSAVKFGLFSSTKTTIMATDVKRMKSTNPSIYEHGKLSDDSVNTLNVSDIDLMQELTVDQKFLKDAVDVIFKEGVIKARDHKTKVVDYYEPDQLRQLFDFKIKDDGENSETLLQLLRDTFKYSVLPANPRFFNQLFSGQDSYGLVGQWLTDCINSSAYTYEVAPLFVLMEHEVIKRLRESIGYVSGDGVFCPGGSIANMYGMNLARYNKYGDDVKTKGLFGLPRLISYTSEHSHYSIKKGASFLGFGTDNVCLVKCDERGRMIPEDLEKKIIEAKEQGHVPLFVNATSGTTVFGAFDPLDKLADICEKHEIWLHVDACWGGSAVMSRKWKHLLKGVERTNSLAWCQHKMMGVPLQCSAFLMRDNIGLMHRGHSAGARYLFQQDKFYDMSYDTGDKVIQCGRKVDAFKLWLMFKAKGNLGFEEEINIKFDNSRYFVKLLTEREGFKLVTQPECTNVCFWYTPPALREMPENEEFRKLLHKVAPIIKERMVRAGTLMIGYQPLGDYPNFFRHIFSNAKTSKRDVEFIVNEIDRLGQDITTKDIQNYQREKEE